MNPTSAFNALVKYAKTGVGITPAKDTSTPPAKSPEASASSSIEPETRVSRATRAFLALAWETTAKPILHARVGVRSMLTKPRTPELPNSLAKFLHPQFIMDTSMVKRLIRLKRLAYKQTVFCQFLNELDQLSSVRMYTIGIGKIVSRNRVC